MARCRPFGLEHIAVETERVRAACSPETSQKYVDDVKDVLRVLRGCHAPVDMALQLGGEPRRGGDHLR